MATYEVRYLGRQSPVEIDGQVVLLRCLRDGNYFQFFTATAGRLDVELALHAASTDEDGFWRCFTNAAAVLVAGAVDSHAVPLADPIEAYNLNVDVREAVSRAAGVEHATVATAGEVLFRFEAH